MKKDPDAILMTAFRNGDKQAFRLLFDKHKKKIVNFCYRFCNNRETAEDLAQEVFLKVYKAAPAYQANAKFTTWLYKIATNVCLNEVRRPVYRVRTDSLDAEEADHTNFRKQLADPQSISPDAHFEKKENDHMILEAIAKLPQTQRAAILLLVDQGFSYQEIARQINRSESGVKSLIHRARATLKDALKFCSQ